MQGKITQAVAAAVLFCSSPELPANNLQLFLDNTFINPANLATTANTHLGVGATITNPHYKLHGRIGPTVDSISSIETFALPNLQFGQRLSECVVVGLDVSQPIFGYVAWPVNGFQNFLGVDAIARSYEVALKGCYQISEKFALAAELRLDRLYDAQLNFAVPGFGFEQNRGRGTTWSGAVGFWWQINQRTFLDGSYFSAVKIAVRGDSISGPFNTKLKTNRSEFLPDTFILNLTHIFNEKFLTAVKVAYSVWKTAPSIILRNVAVGNDPTILPVDLKNTCYVSLFGQYQICPSIAILGQMAYDQSPTIASTDPVSFPTGNCYTGALGVKYQCNKSIALQLMVGQAGADNRLRNPPGVVFAKYQARYTFGDLKLTIDF